jgi:hypothetical protein
MHVLHKRILLLYTGGTGPHYPIALASNVMAVQKVMPPEMAMASLKTMTISTGVANAVSAADTVVEGDVKGTKRGHRSVPHSMLDVTGIIWFVWQNCLLI